MKKTTELYLKPEELEEVNTYLGWNPNDQKAEHLEEGEEYNFTAFFDNDHAIDVVCCGRKNKPAYIKAVLFVLIEDTSSPQGVVLEEVKTSKPRNSILGEWVIEHDNVQYSLNVKAYYKEPVHPKYILVSLIPSCDSKKQDIGILQAHDDYVDTIKALIKNFLFNAKKNKLLEIEELAKLEAQIKEKLTKLIEGAPKVKELTISDAGRYLIDLWDGTASFTVNNQIYEWNVFTGV